jgi:hypothetical protein
MDNMHSNVSRFIESLDGKNLRIFYNSAYGSNHILNNPTHHNWQFKKNPFNNLGKKSIVISEDSSKISSHMGLFPIELKFFNSLKKATWHISFFTLEKYRGFGLGSKITKFSSEFFDFTMVLSGSEGTKKIYENQGGKDFGDLNRYVGILNKDRLEKYIGNLLPYDEVYSKNNSKLIFERINSLNKLYELFWDKVKERYPITTNRTIPYLKWRYLQHPFIEYHFMILRNEKNILGFVILRFEDNNVELKAARIVDLIVFKNYDDEILSKIIHYCKEKVDFIDFFCTGNFYKISFERNRFFNNLTKNLRIPTVFNPIDLNRRPDINFFYKQSKIDISDKKLLENINNWYFVKGDSDQDRSNKT